jgi:hypothetical protein
MKMTIVSLMILINMQEFATADVASKVEYDCKSKEVNLCYTTSDNELVHSNICFSESGTPLQVAYWIEKTYGKTTNLELPQAWIAVDKGDAIDKYKFSNFKSTLFKNRKDVTSIKLIKLNNTFHSRFDEALYEVQSSAGDYAYSISQGGRDFPLGSLCE